MFCLQHGNELRERDSVVRSLRLLVEEKQQAVRGALHAQGHVSELQRFFFWWFDVWLIICLCAVIFFVVHFQLSTLERRTSGTDSDLQHVQSQLRSAQQSLLTAQHELLDARTQAQQ